MKKPRTKLQKRNRIFLIMNLVLPYWLFALMFTTRIAAALLLIAFAALMLNAAVYKITSRIGKGRPVLHISRVIAILCCIVYYLPPVLMLRFQRVKPLYPVKRFLYTKGVFSSSSEIYDALLPKSLPAGCTDFYYRAYGCVIAQDYHPSSYLYFRTDPETAAEYETYYQQLANTEISDSPEDLEWFCAQMHLSSFAPGEDPEKAVLFWQKDRYPRAVLIFRETGLIAVLT